MANLILIEKKVVFLKDSSISLIKSFFKDEFWKMLFWLQKFLKYMANISCFDTH